jgi:hypothetical protein
MMPTGIRVASEDVTLPPDMGDLPTTFYQHRVAFIGDDAYVAGGFRAVSQDQLRTFKISRGETAPIELGNLQTRHHAENASQGMLWLPSDGKIHLSGSNVTASSNDDIMDPATGLWTKGPDSSSNQRLYGVSMCQAEPMSGYFASSGDWYSVSAYVICYLSGSRTVTNWSGSPIGHVQPFRPIIIRGSGNYAWWPAPGAGLRMVRIDLAASSGGFQNFTGLFDSTYSSDHAAAVKLTMGTHAGKWIITGGWESGSVLASVKTWLVDVQNSGAPTTTRMADMPNARGYHTMHELDNGMIVAIGGRDIDTNAISSVDLYDPETNTWTAGPDIPRAPRARHSSAKSPQGNILLVGGQSGSQATVSPVGNVDYLYKDGSKWIKADW